MRNILVLCGLLLIMIPAPAFAAWKDIHVMVKHPATYPLPGVKRLAIVNFRSTTGRYGELVSSELQKTLFQGKVFDILDRSEMDRIGQEQKLTMDGIVDERTASEAGHALGVQALVFGNIDDATRVFDEQLLTQIEKYNEAGEKYVANCPTVVRHALLGVTFKVVDVGSSRVLAHFHQTYKVDQKHVNDPNPKHTWYPPNTNAIARMLLANPFAESVDLTPTEELQQKLAAQAAVDFAHQIAPYDAQETIRFDTVIGDINNAILNLLNVGMGAKASEALEQQVPTIEQSKGFNEHKKAALYYDCGVLHEVLGDLDGASSWYTKAVMVDPGHLDPVIRGAVASLQVKISAQKELQNQMQQQETH